MAIVKTLKTLKEELDTLFNGCELDESSIFMTTETAEKIVESIDDIDGILQIEPLIFKKKKQIHLSIRLDYAEKFIDLEKLILRWYGNINDDLFDADDEDERTERREQILSCAQILERIANNLKEELK
jgi:hypothetical protein